jgi:lysophospholipase L1-like esterase/N-acetylneuraminic acid mutarotase
VLTERPQASTMTPQSGRRRATAGTLILALALVSGVLAAVPAWSGPDVRLRAAPAPLTYVALGDSYSSGEGVEPFDPATDRRVSGPRGGTNHFQSNFCHRSERAYPEVIADNLPGATNLAGFFACSGATTADLRNHRQYRDQPPQIESLAGVSDVDIVTLTIGGNDIGFFDFLLGCNVFRTDDDCQRAYERALRKVTDELPDQLARTYGHISQNIGVETQVFVLGYPQVIVESDDANCAWMTHDDRVRGVTLAARLNEVIHEAVADHAARTGDPFTFIDPTAAGSPFLGHELCSSGEEFFNHPDVTRPFVGWFHPNAAGQAAYASLVMDRLGFGWRMAAPMVSGHGATAATTLTDGRVLVVSGQETTGNTTVAELYDPPTGVWSQTGSLHEARHAFRPPVTLADGRVLIVGGHDNNVIDIASAEVYDPAAGTWSYTGGLSTSRRYAVTVGLEDGRVLVATGAHGGPDGSRFLNSAELYDPGSGQWSPTGSTQIRRESATGVRLHDGRVLLFGGYTCCDFFTPAAEVYNQYTGTWSRAADLPSGRAGAAVAVLADGRVLVAGGATNVSGPFNDALLFDPGTLSWSLAGTLAEPRSGADALLLPDGRVLLAGGGPLGTEIYDPQANAWSAGPSLNLPHPGGKLTLLSDGNVMMIGGGTGPDGRQTEIWRPTLLPPPPPPPGGGT